MRKLLNTLYVTTPEAYLSKNGENVVVSVDGKEIFRMPIINLEAIMTFGYQGASPGVMKLCADKGVALSFYTPRGRFISRVQGPVKGNVYLRQRQYAILGDDMERRRLSSRFIYGKLYNSRAVLRRFVRDYGENPEASAVEEAGEAIRAINRHVVSKPDLDTLRGHEGMAANQYFGVFQNLLLNRDKCFAFDGRTRRPPTNPVNAMLSMGYSMLANDCASALEGVGLDPAAGFMHSLRPGRASLALDLMEEMRAYIVERLVISLINTRQFSQSDFKIHADPGEEIETSVVFTDTGIKKFLQAWQNRKKTEITHPFLGEKMKLGLLPHVQAMMLARNLRGDLDDYPVFLMK